MARYCLKSDPHIFVGGTAAYVRRSQSEDSRTNVPLYHDLNGGDKKAVVGRRNHLSAFALRLVIGFYFIFSNRAISFTVTVSHFIISTHCIVTMM